MESEKIIDFIKSHIESLKNDIESYKNDIESYKNEIAMLKKKLEDMVMSEKIKKHKEEFIEWQKDLDEVDDERIGWELSKYVMEHQDENIYYADFFGMRDFCHNRCRGVDTRQLKNIDDSARCECDNRRVAKFIDSDDEEYYEAY